MVLPRVTALIALAVWATACAATSGPDTARPTTTTGADTTRTTPTPSTSPTTSTVVLPPPEPIAWTACGDGFTCGTVRAPVDYGHPGAGSLEVALVRRPAGDPARRIGTLLVNPGGPGASGIRRVRRGFTVSREVAARFDIVGFDPRGVGASTPISCGSTVSSFRALDLAPDNPAEHDALSAGAQTVAQECATTEGSRLGHLGTREVVHDVEVIRRALGEPRISFVGLSYGTLIGLLWAETYPGSVRAVVLDAVVDPASDDRATSAAQLDGVERTVELMAAGCDASASCALRNAGGMLAAYDELARRVEAKEVTGSGVGPTQLGYAVFWAIYDDARWPDLWGSIAQGLDGDLRGIAAMARRFTQLVAYAPYAIVTCLDAEHAVGYEAWQRTADRLERASPRFGRIAANDLLPCAFWPEATLVHHRVRAPGAPAILVIGSTGDAATPYAQAVRVADDLEAGTLLTVEREGHVALGHSTCADAAATRYLVDLVTPAVGTRC